MDMSKKIVSHERTWTKYNWFNNLIIKIPDKIICISKSVKQNLLNIGVEDNRCEVIFNGRLFNQLPYNILEKYNQTELKTFKIGIMANISEYKGHSIFVKGAISLLKKYPKCRFYIYGDLDTPEKKYLNSLKDIIKRNNIEDKIKFKGYVKDVNHIIESSRKLLLNHR